MIIIDDTGPGMSRENINTVLQSRFSTKGTGLGNGYSLIRNIVANNDGKLTIDSKIGEGTSVTAIFRKPRNID